MPIQPQDIDPAIQAALKERLSQIFQAQTPLDPIAAQIKSAGMRRWRETARRFRGYFWTGGGLFVAAFASLAALAALHSSEALAAISFLTLQVSGIGAGIWGAVRTQQELTRYVNADLMRGAHHVISLTRAEQLYCEAVATLIDAGPLIGETVQREILQQLNTALQSYRSLEAPLQQQHAASGGEGIPALEQELAALTARRDTALDPAARETLEQSRVLCERRLQAARALAPVRERAEAQQSLILQTLASVQSSLARTALSPGTAVQSEVVGLQESMSRINVQARAVEEAVAEVLSLRA